MTEIENLSDYQIGYLAGLIDGEGSLECQRQKRKHGKTPYYCSRLSFVFSTAEPTTTVGRWLGTIVRGYPAQDKKRSPRWKTEVPKSKLVPLLQRVLPHLILKRRQAEIAIEIEALRKANFIPRTTKGPRSNTAVPSSCIDSMDALWLELRGLKSNKRPIDKRRLDFRKSWRFTTWSDLK